MITTIDEVVREEVIAALAYCNGNRTAAAEALGISIRGLRNLIDRYRYEGHEHRITPPKRGVRKRQ